jgi:hypothetical protein
MPYTVENCWLLEMVVSQNCERSIAVLCSLVSVIYSRFKRKL